MLRNVLVVLCLITCLLTGVGGASEANYSTDLNHASALEAYNKGLVYDSLGQIANATGAYRHAVGLDPEFAEAWYNLGMTLYAVSDKFNTFDQAYECFTKAANLDPKLDAWNGDGLRPMRVNSKDDWDYWIQLHGIR